MINIIHPRVEKKPPINRLIKSNNALGGGIKKNSSNKLQPNKSHKKCLDCSQDSCNSSKQTYRCETDEKSNASNSDCNQNIIDNNDLCPFEQLSHMIDDMEKHYNQQQDEILTIHRSFVPIEEIAIISQHSELVVDQQPSKNSSAYNEIMRFLGTLEEPDCYQGSESVTERHLSRNDDREDITKIIAPEIHRTVMKEELATALLKLDDREGTIRVLREELKKEREMSSKKLDDEREQYQGKLAAEKTKYENAMKRHQRFICKLIGEKKELTEKCNCLARKIEQMEEKFHKDLKLAMEKQVAELQRTRDMCMASEKMRRERWLEAKTSKIKEMTVKGLEPELRAMIEKHQEEIQQIKSTHIKELQEVELRAIRRCNQQLEELRLELTQTHEKLLSNEREALTLRYQEKFKEQEALMQMQQRNFFQDLQNEKERFSTELLKKQLENDAAVQRISTEYQEKMEKLGKDHGIEKKKLEESMRAEFTLWAENFKKQQIAKAEMAETRIREQCDQERDRQIEVAIEKLEKEFREMKMNFERNSENKLRCMKEKYDTEMQISQENEKLANEKLFASQRRLQELQDEKKVLEKKLSQSLADCHNFQKQIEQLEKEKEDARKLAREEIEHEKGELRNKISSLNDEIAKINENQELHMTQLYSRVKFCVTQKDVIIKKMKMEANEAKNRCDYLEKMLDQQRKEYFLQTL